MYLIENAIKNIGRNKGRNLLLGGMMSLILFIATLSIMIYSATQHQIQIYKNQLSASVIIYRDDEKAMKVKNYQEPSIEDYKKFATSSLLKSTEMILTTPVSLLQGKALDEDSTKISGIEREDTEGPTVKVSTNMIYGTNHPFVNGEFENDIRKIIEGRKFENINEVIISQQLSKLNNWQINDTIELQLASIGEKESGRLKVTIVGIYEDHTQAYEDKEMQMPLLNRGNEIFTSLETLEKAEGTFINAAANFTIQDPSKIKELEKEMYALGLPQYFGLQADDSGYQKVIAPLMGLRDLAMIFVVSVLVVGGGILILLSGLSIRERTYEVGVLRAIGMKKRKLAVSFLLEGFIITSLSLCLTFGTAKLVSHPVANALFQQQETIQPSQNEQSSNVTLSTAGGFSAGSGTQFEQIQINITSEMMVQIIGMTILFGTIASMGGIYYVMRYEPRKILSDRH